MLGSDSVLNLDSIKELAETAGSGVGECVVRTATIFFNQTQ